MMMKVIWTREGSEPKEWIFDRNNPEWDISYPVEKATDWGWVEFLTRLDGISPSAWRALLWALRKRDEQRLRIEWVEVDWSELGMFFQCPLCEEWDSMQAEYHECAFPAPDPDTQADAVAPEEEDPPAAKKTAKKKAGAPDPEA